MKRLFSSAYVIVITLLLPAYAPASGQTNSKGSTADLQKTIRDIGSLFKKKKKDTTRDTVIAVKNGNRQVPVEERRQLPPEVFSTPDKYRIAVGEYYAMVIIDGKLYGWGDNGYGQLGIGKTVTQFYPVRIGEQDDWKYVVARDYYTLALKKNGTLWAWGWGNAGEMGIGKMVTRSELQTRVTRDSDWVSVSAGDETVVALKKNGSLWIWGSNAGNKLGIGPTPNGRCDVPQRVGKDNDWTTAIAGNECVIALKKDGSLWFWGNYYQGSAMGTATLTVQTVPIQVGIDKDWTKVFAGVRNRALFAIKANGTLWAWGMGGQLGLGQNGIFALPTQVGTDADWATVASELNYSTGIKTDGTLWQWGNCSYYVPHTYLPQPQKSDFPGNWIACCQFLQGIYLKDDGSIWTIGNNSVGTLGISDNKQISASRPVEVKSLSMLAGK